MSKQQEQQTAKIYQFPARPRTASGSAAKASKTSTPQMGGFPPAACGSAWYHDAAVEEAGTDYFPQQH
jgi:hypothetical protein